MEKVRQIIYYKKYFDEFYSEQTDKVKGKIDDVLFLISVIEKVGSLVYCGE
jgi:hypothetical protein